MRLVEKSRIWMLRLLHIQIEFLTGSRQRSWMSSESNPEFSVVKCSNLDGKDCIWIVYQSLLQWSKSSSFPQNPAQCLRYCCDPTTWVTVRCVWKVNDSAPFNLMASPPSTIPASKLPSLSSRTALMMSGFSSGALAVRGWIVFARIHEADAQKTEPTQMRLWSSTKTLLTICHWGLNPLPLFEEEKLLITLKDIHAISGGDDEVSRLILGDIRDVIGRNTVRIIGVCDGLGWCLHFACWHNTTHLCADPEIIAKGKSALTVNFEKSIVSKSGTCMFLSGLVLP